MQKAATRSIAAGVKIKYWGVLPTPTPAAPHTRPWGYTLGAWGTLLIAVVWLVRPVVVVAHYFPLPYYIVGVVFMLVDYIVFIYCVVLMPHDMLMPDYALRAGAAKLFPNNGFMAAHMTAICTIALHGYLLQNICTCLHYMKGMSFSASLLEFVRN